MMKHAGGDTRAPCLLVWGLGVGYFFFVKPKGFHRRGYLPHLDVPGRKQALTFRLADSLPKAVVGRWQVELEKLEQGKRGKELRRRILEFEDSGAGECYLARDDFAELVQDALLFDEPKRYQLVAWCVMPNHVHVILICADGVSLGDVVKAWKGTTARKINQALGRKGSLWMEDYFDRYIRDDEHLARAIRYVHENPVKAGLCENAEDWKWSSAGR